jgi:hypothetical protein
MMTTPFEAENRSASRILFRGRMATKKAKKNELAPARKTSTWPPRQWHLHDC